MDTVIAEIKDKARNHAPRRVRRPAGYPAGRVVLSHALDWYGMDRLGRIPRPVMVDGVFIDGSLR